MQLVVRTPAYRHQYVGTEYRVQHAIQRYSPSRLRPSLLDPRTPGPPTSDYPNTAISATPQLTRSAPVMRCEPPCSRSTSTPTVVAMTMLVDTTAIT